MNITKEFYDLGIPYTKNHKQLVEIIRDAHEIGYRTVAIEETFDHTAVQKKSSEIFPEPVCLDFVPEDLRNSMKILHRLSIIYTDGAVCHAMNTSLNLKRFHILAAIPRTDDALQHCCQNFIGEIVAPDLGQKRLTLNFLHRKIYQQAISRGLCFELKYVPAITDSNLRKELIALGHSYYSKGKSKNVILTSGASNKFHMRGPYDVANLGLIFGMSEQSSKAAIGSTCRSLLIRAEGRRYGKAVMFARNIGKMEAPSSDDEDEEEDDDGDDESENELDEDEVLIPRKKVKIIE